MTDSRSRIYRLDSLQVAFHVMLRKYFKIPDKYFLDSISVEQDRFREILQTFGIKSLEQTHSNPADLVIHFYESLNLVKNKVFPNGFGGLPQTVHLNPYEPEGPVTGIWQYRTLETMKNFFRSKLRLYIKTAILQGSYATFDYISGWSDLDIIILLDNKVFSVPECLRAAKSRFMSVALLCYKIDPLTHHLFSYLTDFDCRYYPHYFFPPEALAQARVLMGDNNLSFITRDDKRERTEEAQEFLKVFRRKKATRSYSRDLYDWKIVLSHFFLWPALRLQMSGIYTSKRSSFGEFKRKFSSLDLSGLEKATLIRQRWQSSNLLKYVPDKFFTDLPSQFMEKVITCHRYFTKRMPKNFHPDEIRKLTEDFLNLMKESL